MRKALRTIAPFALALAVLATSACGGSDKGGATPLASSAVATGGGTNGSSVAPAEALARAQTSLADGYTITVTAANFVLPNWGGSDNGTVQVGADGKTAAAQLRRTGEDSLYALRLVDSQTYYKRGTCDAWARVPGGGPDVLKLFLLSATNAIATAKNPRYVDAADRVVVDATIDGLGQALIQMERNSYRLITIVFGDQPDNAGHKGFTFDFSDFGKPLQVEKPSGDIPDRGPGGAPC